MTSLEELRIWVNEQIANGLINDALIAKDKNVKFMLGIVNGGKRKSAVMNIDGIENAAKYCLELINSRK